MKVMLLHVFKGHSHGHRNAQRMRIQSSLSIHMNPNWNPMCIECALQSIHFGRWLKLDYIIIRDLREVTTTMRSLAHSLAWLFVACGACYITSFCSALAATLGKEEACFSEG